MNKKAQLGKIISYVPILLLVIGIMVLFIFASLAISIKSDFNMDSPKIQTTTNNLLTKTINLSLLMDDGKVVTKKILVYDALIKVEKGEITPNTLNNGLMKLLTKEKNCINIDARPVFDRKLIFFKEGDIWQRQADTMKYNPDSLIFRTSHIAYNNQQININYYFGKCP